MSSNSVALLNQLLSLSETLTDGKEWLETATEVEKEQLVKLTNKLSSILQSATPAREAKISRKTNETSIDVFVDLKGKGDVIQVDTGIGFLDHMLTALAKHGNFNLVLKCVGDLHIDDHHTAEDCAIALGQAFDLALGDRKGIYRYGTAHAPLDESLSMAVVDISSRPHATIDLALKRDMIGTISCEMLKHVLESFATSARLTLHVKVVYGENDHHKAESAFKATALALKQAIAIDPSRLGVVPSTKGVL
eukprot:TRINITY_DN14761_c0_g1_i1.p1 TRINITY_DN14761_c0_g1~~TRINITY_DN14761_c0_g1_i1.p1  ORF type:complete len:250 (-),score=55.09 TRINITY_DN14761_c0_g1_i1:13-762(-)